MVASAAPGQHPLGGRDNPGDAEHRLTGFRTFRTLLGMKVVPHRGADEARTHLPELIANARAGQSTIITKHGVPVAALVPMSVLDAHEPAVSLLTLAGSGRGLWGPDSRATMRALRDEWDP